MNTKTRSTTRIDEIGDKVYRISTPVPPSVMPGGFTFNQYLLDDDEPLLFHTGMRSLFASVREAIASVMPVERLRYLALSHVEVDECGALDDFLAVAPHAVPVCSRVAALVSLADSAARRPRALADGEVLRLGRHELVWQDAAHLPHNWETGYLFERTTATFFCGDLFTHGGHRLAPLTGEDILEPAEAFRMAERDSPLPLSWSHGPATQAGLERFAALRPTTLACMHGSAWQGSGDTAERMIRELARRLQVPAREEAVRAA